MRYVKLSILLAVTALGLAMLGAAGSASATTLCSYSGSPEAGCGSEKGEYWGTIDSTSSNFLLTTGITNITCESSELEAFAWSSTGSPIAAETVGFSLAGCKTSSGTACKATVVNLPWSSGSIETGTFEIGDLFGAGFKFECGILVNCTFTTKEANLGIANSFVTTKLTASKVALSRTGGFCPASAEWDATYNVWFPSGFTVL